jgi:hypothetical protein
MGNSTMYFTREQLETTYWICGHRLTDGFEETISGSLVRNLLSTIYGNIHGCISIAAVVRKEGLLSYLGIWLINLPPPVASAISHDGCAINLYSEVERRRRRVSIGGQAARIALSVGRTTVDFECLHQAMCNYWRGGMNDLNTKHTWAGNIFLVPHFGRCHCSTLIGCRARSAPNCHNSGMMKNCKVSTLRPRNLGGFRSCRT